MNSRSDSYGIVLVIIRGQFCTVRVRWHAYFLSLLSSKGRFGERNSPERIRALSL